ncbi:MAG: hypothetical protein JWR61_2405 [Ferruginibacter sp.]|uniref:DUF5777 family beta-barrel protein n=1 Tax=Ferruginibacter sp. TaxID=1940288 RepID=UPI002658F490|nr:DUF5777 family beta-barrel protein [Ferruginibacter sp.]MDB5277450.1 hypothetical protein [Ferruginibacter sp.]
MRTLLLTVLFFCAGRVIAQDSLSNMLDKEMATSTATKKQYTYATFKGTQLVNSRTIETLGKHELDFRVAHRFGDIGGEYGGEKSFYGLENSTDVKIGFDYGITDRLTVGIGRAKGAAAVRQLYETSLKYKLLRQTEDGSMPVTVTAFGNLVASSMASNAKANTPDHFNNFSDRLSYTSQLLLARKFSDRFSLMVMPTYVHTNYVIHNDQNDIYAAGIGGRLKISKRVALVADYFKVFRNKASTAALKANGLTFYNPFGAGLEFETGGHVFDFTFTNSTAILENQFIPYTTTSWAQWRFRWGFNLSRIFSLKKNK